MPLINCDTNLIFTWSEKCVISAATWAAKVAITDTKICVPIDLSTQGNTKLLKHLESGFKRIFKWNKC